MAKFQFALVLLFVAFAVLSCEAQKQKARRPVRLIQRSRKLARQEAEEPVTPYPSADELKPEVPFEDTFPVDEPAIVEGDVVPDTTDELIPEDAPGAPETPAVYTPDEVYGPPEFENNALARQRVQKARLVKARRQAAYRQAKLAKLRAAKKVKKTKA